MGCAPTFFTPAIIVQRNPAFIRSLQDTGAEIAVHGYHHINLGDLPVEQAIRQLLRAVKTFEHFGIKLHGLRCPYIGYSEELLDALPDGVFDYSSNQAIFWDMVGQHKDENKSSFFITLSKFYQAKDASKNICIPLRRSNLLEIPVCVPDDLQLRDGMQLDQAGFLNVWDLILHQTHLRGELFTLIFHTELASFCGDPIIELVKHARQYQPAVWITRLHEISDWWSEKATFRVEISSTSNCLQLTFINSPRATILVRGLDIGGSGTPWYGSYYLLRSPTLEVPTIPRPFIGLSSDVPENTVTFLHEQGYILEVSEDAIHCGTYIDAAMLAQLTNEVQLINYIEASMGPLVRYWRWPDRAKSALCITGDLDALSLRDYAFRVFGA
jgi:hypothetical protein